MFASGNHGMVKVFIPIGLYLLFGAFFLMSSGCSDHTALTEKKDQFLQKDPIFMETRYSEEGVKDDTPQEKPLVLPVKRTRLRNSDLKVISSLTMNRKTEYVDSAKMLKGVFEMELISKQLFEAQENSALNFLLEDTSKVRKKNGVTELYTRSGTRKYVDKPDAEEYKKIVDYVGQFEFLDAYVLHSTYYESEDYRLIHKTSGKEISTFGSYPRVSPDKQHILCIASNPYDNTADLELYSIKDTRIRHKLSVSFSNWMPITDPGKIFWSTDGYLYLAVNHIHSFWKENGAINETYQYIRIKIL